MAACGGFEKEVNPQKHPFSERPTLQQKQTHLQPVLVSAAKLSILATVPQIMFFKNKSPV